MTASSSARRLSAALEGCRVVVAVDRRAGELSAALERHGAHVTRAPALTIVPHVDDETLLARTREIIDDPPDVVVAMTGVGFRGWIEAADEADLANDLERVLAGTRIVARGAKARGAVQQAGFEVDWASEPETAEVVGRRLLDEGVASRRIAVQHHGTGADGLDALLARHGADVLSLTVYRYGPPRDPQVVRDAVRAAAAGAVDAVLFTSAPGAEAWLDVAAGSEVIDALRERSQRGHLLLAAVGPVTARPLYDRDLPVLLAERGRLGSLVRGVVTRLGDGAPALDTPYGRLNIRSTGAVIDGRHVPLSPSGVAVLRALFDAGGAVVTREDLRRALPGSTRNAHAVEMAVARLREALGAPELVRTVVKRGYGIAHDAI